MSGVGKCFAPAFSSIGLRVPPAALLLVSLTLTNSVGCGGGGALAPTPQATIALSPATLSFGGTAGGVNPGVQTVTVTNTGTATLSFTATASSTPSGWLGVSPTSGTVAAGGSTSLTVSANLASLAAGSFTGSINVSAPGASNSPRSVSVSLAVNNPPPPAPTITSISPTSATAGGAAFTLTVTGSGFIGPSADPVRPHPGSVVQWNGSNRTTTFVNSTRLTASITAADIAAPGTAEVRVVIPLRGTTSNAVPFGITELIPGVGVLERVSVASDGAPANANSSFASVSADGRFVAFVSSASNLVPGDTNMCGNFITPSGPCPDAFVRDTCVGASGGCVPSTIRVSVASDGTQATNSSSSPSISADGRFVAFSSFASNLVPGDTRGCRLGPTSSGNCPDIFVRDTCVGGPGGCVPSTVRVSVASNGSQANERSSSPSISADGRFVAFHSSASNLVPGDTNGTSDIFVHDSQTGETTRVSVASDGAQGNDGSFVPSISADGRFVAFGSAGGAGTCLRRFPPRSADDFEPCRGVFVRDTCMGAPSGCVASTILVSTPNQHSDNASISADGRFVAFESRASIFLHDSCVGASTGCVPSPISVSVASDGTQADNGSGRACISADGRFVAFHSSASNLVPGDTNDGNDVFLRDTCLGAATGCTPSTIRLSVAGDGSQAAGDSGLPSLSADGRFVAFGSGASNLVAGDSNGAADIFVAATGATGGSVIVTSSLPSGSVGTAYSATLQAIGGMPPARWSIDEGGAALPPGVTLDPSSGVLSGVPMLTGTFNFTARITDSGSPARSATQTLVLTVR